MPGPQFGQFHVRSRFSFAFTLPQALQVRPLGNHMGARITRVWRHWPLASSSRAGSPYPRLLARALDFPRIIPGSAHPRQERGGARLSQPSLECRPDHQLLRASRGAGQRGVFRARLRSQRFWVRSQRRWLTRVYIPQTHVQRCPPLRVGGAVLQSSGKRVTGQVSPSLSGMARAGPSRSIGPLPGGSKFSKVITGFQFLAPCIGKRASKSVTGRISRCRCRRCPVSCRQRTDLAPR